MKCKLLDDDRTVRVTMNPQVWEGHVGCTGTSLGAENPFSFDVLPDAFKVLTGPLNAEFSSGFSNGPPYNRVELHLPRRDRERPATLSSGRNPAAGSAGGDRAARGEGRL